MCIIMFPFAGKMVPAHDENMHIRIFQSRDDAMAFIMKFGSKIPGWEIRDCAIQSPVKESN